MKRAEIIAQIKKKKSVLCVGLDTDIKKIPKHLLSESDPIFSFNKAIIDATVEYTVAYKPNIAFYESLGAQGWNALNKTVNYLNQTYPEVFTIADAKRGDIGNTSKMYAEAFFETMNFDSITRLHLRKFASIPFQELRPNWIHPVFNFGIDVILERCDDEVVPNRII